jgi:hypothetical protein
MKNVARSARPEFRRALQRHKDSVKACADFRGPPDPLKGNEPYRKVSDEWGQRLGSASSASVTRVCAQTSVRRSPLDTRLAYPPPPLPRRPWGPAGPGGVQGGAGDDV